MGKNFEVLMEVDGFCSYSEKDLINVKTIFGQHYCDLHQFYKEIFLTAKNYDFVAFVVRRSLVLAEIFYTIILSENKNDQEFLEILNEGREKFCTDTMLLSLAHTWGEGVVKEEFPSILLVDELVMQGDSLNELLLSLEHKVINSTNELIQGESMSHSAIQELMVRFISIKVFCRNQNTLSFYPTYQQVFKVFKILPDVEWRDFSLRASKATQDLAVIHASYTMGARLTQEQVKMLEKDVPDFCPIHTSSDDLKQTAFFYQVDPTFLGCSMVVRSVYRKESDCYSLVPFVFLPDMKRKQFELLAEKIQSRLLGAYHNNPLFAMGTINSYELVSLFLSLSLLEIFVQCYFPKEHRYLDLDKFAVRTNFGFSHKLFLEQGNTVLNNLLKPEKLFTVEELTNTLREICENQPHFLKSTVRPQEQEKAVNSSSPKCIYLEDVVYRKKIDELAFSYMRRQGYHRLQKDNRSMRNFNFSQFIQDLLPEQENDTMLYVAWVLQFMDRGILTLKAQNTGGEARQLIRTGESSIFLFPKRYHDFIPLLIAYKRSAGTDLNHLKHSLIHLQESMGEEKKEIGGIGVAQRLYDFLQFLDWSGQTLEGWDFDLKI